MPADDIARLYTFIAGTTIQAAQANAEFDQVVSAMNGKAGRSVANTFSGNNIFSGQNSFSNTNTFSGVANFTEATTPIKTDKIAEYTNDTGVTVDSVRLKDGMVKVAGTPATSGELGYASNLLQFHNGTTVKTLATTDTAGTMSKGYLAEVAPVWQSASTVRVPTGFRCRDDSDASDIVVASNLDVDLDGGTGALKLDTGSPAIDTFYRLWVCKGSSGVTAIFSTSTSSPTLPSGYDSYKRLLPGAWRNDGSGNLISAYYTHFGPRAEMRYRVLLQGFGGTVGPTNILDGGTSGSYSSFADLTNTPKYIPSESQLGIFKVDAYGNTYSVALRPNGYTTDDYWVNSASGTNQPVRGEPYIPTDSSQLVEAKTNTGDGVDIAVVGFVVTQYTNGLT
jgi:hypothetical protein